MNALKNQYEKEVVPALTKKFEYKSTMQVPKLDKIVINIGLGDTRENPKALENAMKELAQITGQKPIITKAKKSIAAFKIREGQDLGCKVTLRKDKMYDFAYKLFNVALPRVRDFRGVSPDSFDGRGNYSMGLKEQLIFPEIEYDKVDKLRGMDIIFVTTAKTDEEAKELLKLLGMPFGLSPIIPLSCAPIGLKYLSRITLHSLSEIYTSFKICSIINFVLPYGLVVDKGKSSFIGTVFGLPYTVAEELNTIFLQL